MKLTAPQLKRLRKIAETGDTTGPKKPFYRLLELQLIEQVPMPAGYCGIIHYRLTEAAKLLELAARSGKSPL